MLLSLLKLPGCICYVQTLFYKHRTLCLYVGFRAFTTAKDGSKCLAMEYGGEQSLNDLIEKRREDGLKAFPAANIEKVALHVARGLQVHCLLYVPTGVCLSYRVKTHLQLRGIGHAICFLVYLLDILFTA